MTVTHSSPVAEKIVALLPFKLHSERVPNKNFRSFAGKPLFRWMLDKLLSVGGISNVVINTDARAQIEALGVHQLDRVIIRDRRAELCGDFVSMNAIIADDIAAVDADVYFMTHTTNPLLSQQTINDAIRSFRRAVAEKRHDSMFSVTRFQTRFYRSDASPINHDPNNLIRTQDLEPWFAENSNFYLFTKRGFASTRARIGAKPLMVETDVSESIDIDTQKDWDLAEAIAKGTEAAG